jgi:hypothetical protein
MKQTYVQQLNTLLEASQKAIEEICKQKKLITLFEATGKEYFEEEWTEDIYDVIPDFCFYSKHGEAEYAAIKEIKLDGDDVYITGILKQNSYPDPVTIHLMELNTESSCVLADYLASLEDIPPVANEVK